MICEFLIFAPMIFVSKFDKNGLVSFEYTYLTMICEILIFAPMMKNQYFFYSAGTIFKKTLSFRV